MRLESLGLVVSKVKTKQHAAIERYTVEYIFREFVIAKVHEAHKKLFHLKEYYVKDTTKYEIKDISKLEYLTLDELKVFIRSKKLESFI